MGAASARYQPDCLLAGRPRGEVQLRYRRRTPFSVHRVGDRGPPPRPASTERKAKHVSTQRQSGSAPGHGNVVEVANVFISYRSIDHRRAATLKVGLEDCGHTVWLDSEQIRVGDSIVAKIDEGLAGLDYLVLCFSDAGSSPWVDQEWMSTLARQLSGVAVKVLPARLSGGSPPAILAGTRYADLVKDWDTGVRELCAAMAP